MRLKRLVQCVAASLMFTASSLAIAVPTNLGVLDESGTKFERAWVRVFGLGAQAGAFKDTYAFQLANSSDTVGSMFRFHTGSLQISVNSLSLSQVGTPGTIARTTVSPIAEGTGALGSYSLGSFVFPTLAAGSYLLDVDGMLSTARGVAGLAYYQGSIKAFASPAPEPAALMMGLAGLLAVGSVLRLRGRR